MAGADFRDGALMVNIGGAVGPAEHRIEPGAGVGTKMARANLQGAKMHRSVIKQTDLSGAILRNADLSHANLSGTNLKDADLRGANLHGCNLSRAFEPGNGRRRQPGTCDPARHQRIGVAFENANCDHVDFPRRSRSTIHTAAARGYPATSRGHERWVETSGAEGEQGGFRRDGSLGAKLLRAQS